MARPLSHVLDTAAPIVLSVFRIVIGLLMASHGTAKLFGWPTGDALPVGSWPAWWAGLIELVVGVSVTIGLGTRAAAFLGSGNMAVAYFWGHASGGFWPTTNGGEPAVLYCFALFLLVFTGPGAIALTGRTHGTPRASTSPV